MKLMIYLAVICCVALSSCTATGRAGGTKPNPAPADSRPMSIAPLTAQETALRTSLAQTAVVITRSGRALELWYPVRLAFAPDGTGLLAPATAMLDVLARSLREHGHTAAVVAVYTDAIGSNSYNEKQSLSRSQAVVAYLETKGVSPARLTAKGLGESAPLETPNTPEGRDLNRRLQVVITPWSEQT